jgi:hypothetical protein
VRSVVCSLIKSCKSALRLLLVILVNVYLCTRADYGIYGILLMLMLSLTDRRSVKLLLIAG